MYKYYNFLKEKLKSIEISLVMTCDIENHLSKTIIQDSSSSAASANISIKTIIQDSSSNISIVLTNQLSVRFSINWYNSEKQNCKSDFCWRNRVWSFINYVNHRLQKSLYPRINSKWSTNYTKSTVYIQFSCISAKWRKCSNSYIKWFPNW